VIGQKRLTGVLLALLLTATSPVWASGVHYETGDSGPVVEQIQTSLKEAGYFGGQVNGQFTGLTKQAVQKFQKDSGLKADGIVEEKTYQTLTGKNLPLKSVDNPNLHSGGTSDKILTTALSFKGVKYRFGGTTPAGFDCSGFVMYVFNKHGVTLPRTADKQYEVGRHVNTKSDLKPGDLVFFQTYEKGASHVGIYQGNGSFVHASSSHGVTVSGLSESYYASRYLGARRVL